MDDDSDDDLSWVDELDVMIKMMNLVSIGDDTQPVGPAAAASDRERE